VNKVKIRYIVGRAGSGKTHLVLNEIRHKLKENDDNKLILLVPEQFTLQAEFDLITKMDLAGIMRAEVLSFERLAYKVFNEVGGIKKIDINEQGKIMVLRRLFDKHSKELTLYKKAFRQAGFLSNFCNLISEFKRSDILPEMLKMKLDSFEEENILKRKLQDLTYMYEKFNEYMEGRYTDGEDKFNLLIEKMDDAKFLNGAEIWIDGFHGFTSQEYRIIEKIILKAKKVNVTLTIDFDKNVKDRDLFTPTLKTLSKLREIAKKHGIKEIKTILKNDINNKSEELEHLERQIYAYPYKRYQGKVDSIHIFAGTNQYTEIENAASQIVSLVRDKGYRWKDIAVVTASIETYGHTIKRVFTEYGIPFFIDEKRSILNNPIIKLILSGIEILYRNFKYEDVFRFIKTGFSNLDKNEYEKLENYVLRYGIEGNKWFDNFTYGEENLDEINEIRSKFVMPFINMKNKLRSKNLISDLTKYVFEFLTELNVEEKLNSWIERLREEGNLEYVNENTQIWNIVMETFDQLVEILGDTKVTLREFSKILEAGFSEYKVGIIPPTTDQVMVGNLERSKSHDIKALFVVGVNDGVVPSIFDDGGLLLDDEKIVMKDMGIPISSDSETRVYEERFLIYTAFSKPSEYLWVSYALSDCEGRALRPSILIDRLKKLYPKITVNSDIVKNEKRQLHLISRPVSTFKYLVENIRQKIDGNPVEDMWEDVYNWYYNNEEWHDRLKLIIEGLFHDNQEGYIGENKTKALYNIPLRSSISRLEKFVNCPFSHFINYGLKPEERKEYKLKIPDIGRLFHTSVEKFAKRLNAENLDWRKIDREKCDEIVEKVIEEIIPEFENSLLLSSHRYKYLVNKLKRISKRAVWTLTEHIKRGDFMPFAYELEFGEGEYSQLPSVIIELPGGEEIKIEGRIDRIDILKDEDGSYVKIIDYKSGNKKFSLSDVYYGLQIQLIVYLDAVMENKDRLVKDELYPGGVFYFKIDDPMVKSEEIDESVIEKEILKQLRMDGLILKNVKVVKAMDRDIETERNSPIIPVQMTKNGDFGKRSSAVEEEELKGLIKHVRNLIIEIAVEILKGNIKIEPCKIGNRVSCEYCQYISICQFDTRFENNRYRNIKKLTNEEVIEKIRLKSRGDM